MQDETRAIGYICPDCGKPVYAERTIFSLTASLTASVCDCARSELTLEPTGTTHRITVPCGVCGGEHRAEVPTETLLHGEGAALACPTTKNLCCYIGHPRRVETALRQLEITLEKRKDSAEAFVDSVIMYEVLSELKDIASRGGITCTCGSTGCSMEVRGASVDLVCPDCGARLRVPAATDEDLDRLCCQYTLTIRGKKPC